MAKLNTKDLAKLSIEELEEISHKLDEEKQAVIEQKRAVADMLSEKVLEAQAIARLESMSDPEKEALLQYVKAHGIESTAKVGTPGGSEDDE